MTYNSTQDVGVYRFMSVANDRTAIFEPTAYSVEAVFLEAFSLGYLLIDGISGYVLGNVTVESGVKVRD